METFPGLPHSGGFSAGEEVGYAQPVEGFGSEGVAGSGGCFQFFGGFVEPGPSHEAPSFTDPQGGKEFGSGEVADRLVLECAVAIHEDKGGRPDYVIGTVEGLVGFVIDVELDRDEVGLYVRGYFGLRIRHGIQEVTTCSRALTEIYKEISALGAGALEGGMVVGFPGDWHSWC